MSEQNAHTNSIYTQLDNSVSLPYEYSYKEYIVFSIQHRNLKHFILIISTGMIFCTITYSQELEPRSLTNVPIGTNFAALAYTYAAGNVLFDQALPLDNVNTKTHSFIGAYARSINFFGMGAKYNVILPHATGNWKGIFDGIDTTTSRTGLADLRFGFSFNFIGSPALNKEDYISYQQKTIVGFKMQVIAPTGQYFNDRLINLGSNRWAFRSQLGVSHKIQSWYIEYYLNTWIYTTNYSFWNGNKIKQKPLGTFKLHIIKSFKKGIWAALGAGYAFGGQTYVNNELRNAKISTIRLGGIVTVPFQRQHSLKLVLLTAKRFKEGADFDAVSLTYQFMWNNKK